MSCNNCFRGLILGLALNCCFAFTASAQETTIEFWPEIDAWYRISPAWRFSMYLPLSKNLETKYREGNLVLQADYTFGKSRVLQYRRMIDDTRAHNMKVWLVRGGYLGAKSLGDNGEAYKEHMAFAEIHARTPLKGKVLLSQRLRADLRWIGDEFTFSTRYRYRVMVEKEWTSGKVSVVPYVNVEPYYDSRYEIVNRVRLIGGTSLAWNPRFALEGNITYQYDSRSSVTHLYALNVILHVYFETKRARA
ncbi:MAG: DUF2490 domain-containing protein [Saprospiraceae bacterium]|nr:DUF2490 domain-containing protein [Saprospiraceae bacterium]